MFVSEIGMSGRTSRDIRGVSSMHAGFSQISTCERASATVLLRPSTSDGEVSSGNLQQPHQMHQPPG